MRYLNKLVFINCATIPYAEVLVDGNVHLIGTQGVGKSTLLRAILFFYNADTLKLGIPREKKSFAEYYFPFQNSYLIYEIMRENGPFCIIAFKSQGKVCFRFFDSAYEKNFFLSSQGQAFEKWEDIRHSMDKVQVSYSRKIDSYGEYRDILYGNNETGKRDFARYALLQSRQYQNIPRTIQNVFLNSKLDAEFIKQTIIMSLNEEEIDIDLEKYSHHLKGFEAELADIQIYKQPATQKLAENIIKYHTNIRHLSKDKNTFAGNLTWAVADAHRNLPKQRDKLEKALSDKEGLNEKKMNAETRQRNRLAKIQGEISIMDNELKKAKEKGEHYAKLEIHKVLARVEQKKMQQGKLRGVEKELDLLTRQFSELSHKYEALIHAIDQEQQEFTHQKQNELLQMKGNAMDEEKTIRRSLQESLAEIRSASQGAEQQASQYLDQQNQLLQTKRLQKESARHEQFYEQELREIRQEIFDLKLSSEKALQQVSFQKNQLQTLMKQWELDESRMKDGIAAERERTQQKIKIQSEALEEVQQRLANSADALYGWLNQHVPGWEENIGKVINDSVLFNKELSPEIIAGNDAHLYGVKLRLEELPVTVKTLADYEKEQEQIRSDISTMQAAMKTLDEREAEEAEKLKRKYQPQTRQAKDVADEQQYIAERDSSLLQQKLIMQKGLEIKAADKKREVLNELDKEIDALNSGVVEAQIALQFVRDDLNRQLTAKQKEADKKIAAIEKAQYAASVAIDEAIARYGESCRERRIGLVRQRDNELEGKGIDTKRITTLEADRETLQKELKYIDENADVVAEYKKDKRELLDKVDEFKNRKSGYEQQYVSEEKKFHLQQAALNKELEDVEEQIRKFKEQANRIEENIHAFDNFRVTGLWQAIEPLYKEEKEMYRTEKPCRALIDDINRCDRDVLQRWDLMKDITNKFVGSFSTGNIFNFKSVLTYNEEYSLFAEELNEFVNNRKIDEFEKRINERFANIIHSVGHETSALMSKSGEIQKVISDINKDFDSKNFVTAIQKIELRLDDSVNPVVRLLILIRQFNDEHAYDLGAINLFSSVDQDAKNRKAVELLKQLGKVMLDYKKDTVSLSDTFELKFRIEENGNDSGWVEKLSNVGSEGTDVLVKAMINIMLLNVFKEGASRKFKDFRLHCMMDEIGKLHPVNVKGILQFANDRNINLVNGSPTETNAFDYKHIYRLEKDAKRNTRIKRIVTNLAMA